ncbi:MAG: PBP1A family penicillin-binding protein [Chthoniobacter sp.]|uniref:transglycosylase domain-containing protein n=1 Tax=Chthoniobacter sp. TaxID=2510640 RepID=UPI0032A189EE
MAKTAKNKNKPGAKAARARSRWKVWLALGALVMVLLVCLVYGFWASSFDMREVMDMTERSAVYDMDGKVYSRLPGQNRVTVKLAQVSPYFVKALLSREDARFYQHHGVDPFGILRAVFRNLTHGSAKEGASTLTQQLARNSFPEGLGARKSLHRKILEAFVAARIEQNYSKDQILEAYMNRIYFGSTVYGIETASLTYFGKHAADLSLGEAATIAGLIRAPSYFSPLKNFKGAMHERDTVLDRMVKLDKIKADEAARAKSTPVVLAKRRPTSAQDNYAMDMVRRELDDLLSDEQRQDGGMKIYTTLDPALQKTAESVVDLELTKVEARPGYKHPKKADFSPQAKAEEQDTPYLQGALVVIDNRSGGIRAIVGGRDFSESKYNRAIAGKASRQIGSTFKPFVYAAAFDKGLLPGTSIDDGPIARGEVRQAANWSPENSDGTYKGPLRLEEGLIQSRNTMSVRVGERAGMDEVARVAAAVGIENMPHLPAVYLGAFEANVADLTAAYTVFPNNGVRRQSYIIERIDDAAGETIYRAAHIQSKALDPGVAWMLTSTLGKVMERGTAASAKTLGFTKPAAGKTGTTNDFRDAWFVGYTTSLTCGVWVGLDKPETIISKGYGSALALPIWVDVMKAASAQRYPAESFRPPVPLRRVTICSISNQLATNGCDHAGTAYNIDLPESRIPRDGCSVHRGSILAQGASSGDDNPKRSLPQSIFRSFRKFFGGE